MVLSVETDIRDKSITITTSSDINAYTVSEQSLCVYDKQNPNEMLQFESYTVKNNIITLFLKDWPIANFKYYIKLIDIENAVSRDLKINHGQTIIFKSNVISKVVFKSPILNSIITNQILLTIEELSEGTLVDSFYIELASDPYFNNLVYKTNFSGPEHLIELKYNGQLYARCRVQKLSDGQYGAWEKTSFVISSDNTDLDIDNSIYEPEYVEEMVIELMPQNGTTPKDFSFAFDSTIINQDDIQIIVVRRDY